MDLDLTGTRVLVTGGSRGIGRAVVEAFLDEGARVAFCARNPDEVKSTQDELGDRGTAVGSALDVGDTEALAGWVAQSADAFGGLDVVVANVSALAMLTTCAVCAGCAAGSRAGSRGVTRLPVRSPDRHRRC